MCEAWRQEDDCPPGATAIGGECWRLGGVGQSCGQVCGADEKVNLEGTTDGCWREAVVLCLNDQVHGEQSHSE